MVVLGHADALQPGAQTRAPILADTIAAVRAGRPDAHGLTPADAHLSLMDFQTTPPGPARRGTPWCEISSACPSCSR
jgi:hypothetical protein